MKSIILSLITLSMSVVPQAYSQTTDINPTKLQAVNVFMSSAEVMDGNTIRVIKDAAVKEFDEPTFAKLKGVNFRNGTIEVKVLSKLLKDAPDFARGFIGVAFRVNESNSKFECIYLRPTNGGADNQLRRNRSVQYFSFPDFKFERLRKEAPSGYEPYADIGLDEWIDLKIEVRGARAKLFVNGSKQPSLIVNDLKRGADSSGAIGLWVDVGTDGYFSDLRVHND